MQVIAINGSPRARGNTNAALELMGARLGAEGIGFEIIQVGQERIRGCLSCGECGRRKDGKCVFDDDPVNGAVARMAAADGIVLASPVHYSGLAGAMKCFLDRAFVVAGANGGLFRHKAGAALVVLRRSGGSAALDGLYHYLAYAEMLLATSSYWNIAHGSSPGELAGDAEGLQIVEVLAGNLAWLLKMRELSRSSLPEPPAAAKVRTNFVR
ncbi:MAG TPA: flavodoxin family protein [Spirochaetales bacterium]|nr:flavodoxin family protein [Spirochaetales bacterium]HRY55085.1 flavodoxin family protein [Spirochaetia bacterium]HRZ64935.1 flavodoxin family protein [Spirochaetia bacterium]